MESGLDAFLEDAIVLLSFWYVSLQRTIVEVNVFEVVFNFFKNGAELSVTIEIADVKPVAAVQL